MILTADVGGSVQEAREEVELVAALQEGVLNHIVHRYSVHLQPYSPTLTLSSPFLPSQLIEGDLD